MGLSGGVLIRRAGALKDLDNGMEENPSNYDEHFSKSTLLIDDVLYFRTSIP